MKSKEKTKSNSKNKMSSKEYLEKILNEQKENKFLFKSFMDKLSFDYLKEIYKEFFKKKKMLLIEIHLPNNKTEMFTISTDKEYFIHDGGAYYIDNDFIKYDTHTKLSKLVYHKECAIPFLLEWNIDELKTALEKESENFELTINPRSLKQFINSNVIEKVLKGGELSKDMDFLKKLIVINVIISAIVLLIMAKSMGIF